MAVVNWSLASISISKFRVSHTAVVESLSVLGRCDKMWLDLFG